jgi:predicted permease
METLFPGLIEATLADSMRGTTLTPDQQREFIASQKRNRGILDPIEHGTSILLRKQFAVAVKVLMGAVGALLLLVCANIAGLMLARGEASRKEIAVRLSLGATRFAIASQLIVDALVLSIFGAGAAMVVTRYGGPMLLAFLPSHRPTNLELIPDASVLAFAAGICVVTAIAMSMMPALSLFRADLTTLMGRGGPRQRRSVAGIVLVGLQVALSVILLVGGGALVHTLGQLRDADLGMDRHNFIIMVVKPWISSAQFRTQEQVTDAMKQVLLRARELPGVDGASLSSAPQMRGLGPKMSVQPTGTFIRDSDFLNATFNNVTPGYFENAGMRILAGRDFRPSDITTKKPIPVVISAGFAKRFFPNQSPIGKTFGSGMNVTAGADSLIIGVVNDVRFRSMREEAAPIVYAVVDSFYGATLSVRTRSSPGPVISELRAMLASVGPGLAPSEVGTMEQDIETSLWQERLIAALALVFAIASAVLVAVGLYGMLAYSIARRTREIGIRMALGARPGHLVEMISRDVALSVGPGLALGLIVYAACARILAPVLYGVRPMDAASILVAMALIALVAAAAGFVPARRALSVPPSEALRQE